MTSPLPPPLSSFVGASSRSRQKIKSRPAAARDDVRAALGVIALEGLVLLTVTLAAVPAHKVPVVRIALAVPALKPAPIQIADDRLAGGPLRPSILLANLGPAVPAPPWRPAGEASYAALPPSSGNPADRRGATEPVLDTSHVAAMPEASNTVMARGDGSDHAPSKPAPVAPSFALLPPEMVTDDKARMASLDRSLALPDANSLSPGFARDTGIRNESVASAELAAPVLDHARAPADAPAASQPVLVLTRAMPAGTDRPAESLDRAIRQPSYATPPMLAALDKQIGSHTAASPVFAQSAPVYQHLGEPEAPPASVFAAGLELTTLSATWESPDRDETQARVAKLGPHGSAPTSATQLTNLFDRFDYSLDTAQGLPPVFVNHLPNDIGRMAEAEDRKDLFLRTLLPLIAQVNERTIHDRERVMALAPLLRAGAPLKPADEAFVSQLADDYGTGPRDVDELLRRVDVVPPSLALAQAAQETGWGTSHPAQEGNALFGEMTYVMVSEDNHRHAVAKVRRFDDLAGAVGAYIRNLNTHRAYHDFRAERARLRLAGKQPDGHALAPFIQRYSERGPVYTQMLRSLIQWNNLTAYDGLRLDLSEQSAEVTAR